MRTPEVPHEFVELAGQWYSGQFDLLYAVASAGNLERGTQRPWNDDESRSMTDDEWLADLWRGLSIDVAHARRTAEKSGHEDTSELQRFEDFCDSVVAQLEANEVREG
jgi:hypothetical protein